MEMTSNEKPLAKFISEMPIKERGIIEEEVLYMQEIPIEFLDKIDDIETARNVMTRFKQYLQWKEDGNSKQDLKKEAQDIAEYIYNLTEEPEVRKAA
jgi:hypothetical protein